MPDDKTIEFLRYKDFILAEELGKGACGKTVLLYDETIEESFVCKKYCPYSESNRENLFNNFIREIKLLHHVFHQNIVRFFSYYLYPTKYSGYIIMEYVDGFDIQDYLLSNPSNVDNIFKQTINGFAYLESKKILHRDIRVSNILVTKDHQVKIIDFGFGKKIERKLDFNKSISLNWWCELPNEFNDSLYDFKTEVYFIGKLFEKCIRDYSIESFSYKDILLRMCAKDPDNRINSFFDVEKETLSKNSSNINISEYDAHTYRRFAESLSEHISRVEYGTKYHDDPSKIEEQLDSAFRKCMLEEFVPDCVIIIRCFIDGAYYYKKTGFPVDDLNGFIGVFKSSSLEKKRIILANLHTRLDSLPRYSEQSDDDIPF